MMQDEVKTTILLSEHLRLWWKQAAREEGRTMGGYLTSLLTREKAKAERRQERQREVEV